MKMRHYIVAVAAFAVIGASAQSLEGEKFAVKLNAGIGIGNAVNVKSDIPALSGKSSSSDYEATFGWTFWKKNHNSLELNIGLGFSPTSLTLDLQPTDYHYNAPSTADIDGDSYIRYYDLDAMSQKSSFSRINVPIYLSYAYRCASWLGVHADLGVRMGFKASAKMVDVSGSAFSYGVYPQYDNLIIDAPYLNDFGQTDLSRAYREALEAKGFTAGVLVGIGAEFRIYGPLAADLSLHYNAGLTNLYANPFKNVPLGNNSNVSPYSAPVSYTVAQGQSVKSMTSYLSSSKLSQLSVRIGLICRF